MANMWIRPRGGIRQGDSLSPALFVLVTAILCIMLRKQMPQTVPMLYADDTLIWIPGNLREIGQELRTLKQAMAQYAKSRGQEMHQGKSKVVLQGEWPETPSHIEGFQVVQAVRYLGIQLGRATTESRYAAPLKIFERKMVFLQSLPLSESERAKAILTWACPVFSVAGKVVYPTEGLMKKVDTLGRAVMGIKSWGLTTQILTQRKEQGGADLVMPSVYLRHLHSKYHVKSVLNANCVPKSQQEEFNKWRSPALSAPLARTMFNWTQLPLQAGMGARGV